MLRVITHPNPVLTQRCDEAQVDDDARALIRAMAEEMYASAGVGLAAPQVGILKRIALIDPTSGDADQLIAMINPVITWRSQELEVGEEGCLSLPGVALQIPRHEAVQIDYINVEGARQLRMFTKMWARVAQHEIDHLDGVTLLEKVSPLARRFALRSLQ